MACSHSGIVEAAERRARAMLERGASLRDVLSQLTSAVEQVCGDEAASSILVLDREGLLRNGASPNMPADYLDKIDRLRPAPDVGTCAAAAATGEMVFTPDFDEDSKWSQLRHLPLAIGFRGAWSAPIKDAKGRVLGTFGTYFRNQRLPTDAEQHAVTALLDVAAQAIAARTAA